MQILCVTITKNELISPKAQIISLDLAENIPHHNNMLTLLRICFIFTLNFGLLANAQESTQAPMTKSQGKQAIEQFLGLTSIWMLELEWTHAYKNKTPNQDEFRDIMLAAGIENCPKDFQEAWINQMQKPGRNYTAPILREYGVKLSDVRKKLQKDLFKINPRINPPIPLYDEDEVPPKVDPTRYGQPADILKALNQLRAQHLGISLDDQTKYKQAIHKVMLEFMVDYLETSICMNVAGIPKDEVSQMFASINTTACPKDFQKAWTQDLPHFQQGIFDGAHVSPMCKRYGVDRNEVFNFVKKKMTEWDITVPQQDKQPQFRQDIKELKANIMGGR